MTEGLLGMTGMTRYPWDDYGRLAITKDDYG